MGDYECEWGGNIRFLAPSCVSMHDADGNEIEVPKCEMCGNFKNPLIGKEAMAWICGNYCTGSEGGIEIVKEG